MILLTEADAEEKLSFLGKTEAEAEDSVDHWVHYCSEEKETWAILFSGERNWYIYTGALLIPGERNWCTNVFRKRELGALLFLGEGRYSFVFRRRKKGGLLVSGERNWCSAVLKRRKHVLYCF